MKKLLFSIAAVCGVLILAEAVCRFASPDSADAPAYMRFTNPHRRQSGFIPDDALFWKLKPDNPVWEVNSKGFRGPEIPDKKADDEFRVICAGDSCTFGLGAGGVPYEQTYPALVGKGLFPAIQAKSSENPLAKKHYNSFRALNFGCPGYTSYQGLKLLESGIEWAKPDVIVAYFGINDGFEAVGYADKDQRPVELADNPVKSLLLKSSLYSSFTRMILRSKQRANGGTPVERVSMEDYHKNLGAIAELAKKHGAKAYFIAPPYLEADGSLNCETQRIHEPVIDVMPNLKEAAARGGPVIFPAPDNVHPTPAGHEAIAKAIVTRLADEIKREKH